MARRVLCAGIALLVAVAAALVAPSVARAAITATTISDAWNPLAIDIDSAGNIWIGYSEGPMAPKGVTVIPATTGTLFNVPVAAGVETRIFDLAGVQGILMSPAGELFVSASGNLYVATAMNSVVFGVPTTANTLTLLSFAGSTITAGHLDGGLAMDSAGNLFGGRKAANGVGVVPVSSGLLYGVAVQANISRVLITAPEWTGDVAIDSLNNLYIGSWFGTSQGVHVLPKTGGTLYGQNVSQDTLQRLVAANRTSGIDIDGADNIYFAQWGIQRVNVLSPATRTLLGQAFTANVPDVLAGSGGLADQGLAASPDGTFLVSGARTPNATVRITAASPPTIASVTPSTGSTAGGQTVTIVGTDLAGVTDVSFGGIPATDIVQVSGTSVTVLTPPAAAGTVNVTVAAAGGVVTEPEAFTYVTPPSTNYPPGQPISVLAEPTVGGADVTWLPPEDSGTAPIELYAVRSWPGGATCEISAPATSCAVVGLDPNTSYRFTVSAFNSVGWGSASAPSNTIRPLTIRTPSDPRDVVAAPGDRSATVTWVAPADPGSSPVLEYRVTSSPAGGACLVSATLCTIDGLRSGEAYSFVVEARNAAGWGLASAASSPVTPYQPTVSLTGQRSGRRVQVLGTTEKVATGSAVTVWSRVNGQAAFVASPALVRVDDSGNFAWQRRINPGRGIEVYAVVSGVTSPTVVVSSENARVVRKWWRGTHQ